jgi:hypothetical protein
MTTESKIDESVPADNVQVDKALIRANFRAAKDEIEDIYQRIDLPYQMAFGSSAMLM